MVAKPTEGMEPSDTTRMTVTATVIITAGADAGRQFVVSSRETAVIGRSRECTIAINDSAVSRRHLELEYTPKGWALTDLSARGGTKVNGAPLVGSIRLMNNVAVKLGNSELHIDIHSDSVLTSPASATAQGAPVYNTPRPIKLTKETTDTQPARPTRPSMQTLQPGATSPFAKRTEERTPVVAPILTGAKATNPPQTKRVGKGTTKPPPLPVGAQTGPVAALPVGAQSGPVATLPIGSPNVDVVAVADRTDASAPAFATPNVGVPPLTRPADARIAQVPSLAPPEPAPRAWSSKRLFVVCLAVGGVIGGATFFWRRAQRGADDTGASSASAGNVTAAQPPAVMVATRTALPDAAPVIVRVTPVDAAPVVTPVDAAPVETHATPPDAAPQRVEPVIRAPDPVRKDPKRTETPSADEGAATMAAAAALYKDGDCRGAAEQLDSAATRMAKAKAGALRARAASYRDVCTAIAAGKTQSTTNPAATLATLRKAQGIDKKVGGGQASVLRGLIAKVAPAAAVSAVAKRDFVGARSAVNAAVDAGSSDARLASVNAALEREAVRLVKEADALAKTDSDAAADLYQRVLALVDEDTAPGQKATAALE